jgi:hypothetical protein
MGVAEFFLSWFFDRRSQTAATDPVPLQSTNPSIEPVFHVLKNNVDRETAMLLPPDTYRLAIHTNYQIEPLSPTEIYGRRPLAPFSARLCSCSGFLERLHQASYERRAIGAKQKLLLSRDAWLRIEEESKPTHPNVRFVRRANGAAHCKPGATPQAYCLARRER